MMTGFRLNLSPLKEPLGFVKLVEWVREFFVKSLMCVCVWLSKWVRTRGHGGAVLSPSSTKLLAKVAIQSFWTVFLTFVVDAI